MGNWLLCLRIETHRPFQVGSEAHGLIPKVTIFELKTIFRRLRRQLRSLME
jgi:hypothetical protein